MAQDTSDSLLKARIEQAMHKEIEEWSPSVVERQQLLEAIEAILDDFDNNVETYSAGSLRALGVEIDETIPDCATAEGTISMHIQPNDDPNCISIVQEWTPLSEFTWATINCTIE